MKRVKRAGIPALLIAIVAGLGGYIVGSSNDAIAPALAAEQTGSSSAAQQNAPASTAADNLPVGRQSTAIVPGQYPSTYFPNTEVLGDGEMRITALGTGMPNQTKRAVSISYLVELGNGDKFLFDVGSGMLGNLFSLRPDFSKIDKVFASHLHVDHVGDFMGVHIGGWLSGRYTPIHLYGPSGSKPELGTKAFAEAMKKAYAWDLATRSGALPDAGAQIAVHEFDYKQMNEVVYQQNGVTIRMSFPALPSIRIYPHLPLVSQAPYFPTLFPDAARNPNHGTLRSWARGNTFSELAETA